MKHANWILLCLFWMCCISLQAQDEKPKQLASEELWKELPDLDRALSDSVPLDTSTVILSNIQIPRSFMRTRPNELLHAAYMDDFFHKVANRKNKSVRVVHLGDSHVRGHVLPVAVRKKLEEAWGGEAMVSTKITYQTSAYAQETGENGFIFHALGKNGATLSYFQDEAVLREVASLHPDLVILSLGTNESHGKFDGASYQLALADFHQRLCALCPGVTLLLTTPPGSYKRRMPNRVGGQVAASQRSFAASHKLPVWDLYEIVGGDVRACMNWRNARMMAKDGVHYTHEAYNLQGNLLGEAILKAYNESMKRWTK